MSWREGGEGGGMRETFSSVPTARATPLSFPLRVFSLCFSHPVSPLKLSIQPLTVLSFCLPVTRKFLFRRRHRHN